jgi:hypothetical protein
MDALIWLLVWLALSIAVGTVAERRGKNAAMWMVISVLISPLIAYVILAVSESDDIRTCPFCAEKVKAAARVCRYCHHDLPRLVRV